MTTCRIVCQINGFSSTMRLLIIFIFMPLVYSELHRFLTSYTIISSQRFTGFPEFSSVTTLDDHQIDYYDSNIKKLIPKQDWEKDDLFKNIWKEYTDIREKLQQNCNKISNYVQMEQFTQSDGVHVYQRRYGCEWNDVTGHSHGFDQHGYDGEDFISLDLKEDRYITHTPQATPTVEKWNNDTAQLTLLKRYIYYKCVDWLRRFLDLSKDTFKKTEPKVSLLQKNPDYNVECHVTGFLFRDTNISWRKDGQAMNDSMELESRVTLPNGDGTFQRTVALYVQPNEWKKDRYTCVVEHKSWAEPIQEILTEDQIKTNKPASDSSNIKYLALIIIPVIVVLIGLCIRLKLWKKSKAYYKKMMIYYNLDHPPTKDPLLFNSSNESSSNVRPPRKPVISE